MKKKKSPKMNALYKISFILLFVCIALFIAAAVLGAAFDLTTPCMILAAIGCALCLAAIILAMLSKPKKSDTPN